jgi:predicted DsbA family dithiol-disulfide isomerase
VRVAKLEREYNLRVEYVNFPLHPETPPEGVSLLEKFGGESARPRLRQSQERLKALAAAEGLPLADRERTYNSRLAQELGVWATAKGRGEAFHDAAYRAYFVEGKNIHDSTVLQELATKAGLDPAEAMKVLRDGLYKEAVDRDWASSRAAGITGVPTFEAGGRRVVGAQPYQELARMVEAAGATRTAGSNAP